VITDGLFKLRWKNVDWHSSSTLTNHAAAATTNQKKDLVALNALSATTVTARHGALELIHYDQVRALGQDSKLSQSIRLKTTDEHPHQHHDAQTQQRSKPKSPEQTK
jgi:hypothetical protein